MVVVGGFFKNNHEKTSHPANRDRGGRQELTVCFSEEEERSVQRQMEEAQEAKKKQVGGADELVLHLQR